MGQNFAYDIDAASLGAVGGFTVSATTVAIVGLYALSAIDEHRSLRETLRLRPALPLAAFAALSPCRSRQP